MKWCQFEGVTFDRSKVTHFSVDNFFDSNDDRYQLRGHLDFSFSHSDENPSLVTQAYVVIGGFGTRPNREQAIVDICSGKYDVPGQSRFVPITTAGGYEKDHVNLDHVIRVNASMGGLRLYLSNGERVDVDQPHRDSPGWLQEEHHRIYRALGDASHELLCEKRAEKKVMEPGMLDLYPLKLVWGGQDMYRSTDGAIWGVDKYNGLATRVEVNGECLGVDLQHIDARWSDTCTTKFILHDE